ncbi:MAG: hypothetical protein ATN34_04370 [Epulopiscium sp. Nele67-Bin002]|nr:MAG: hypothetical protein BEN18_10560 [Epulopiscium sp. Nuni2H_MBin001]OON91637.1 MAG: hypothetical protein ATN34_04370 [Epulopiscium sp. Nele67-Bin002]
MMIFVYGTLMKGYSNHDRCLGGYVVGLMRGTIRGKLYHMREGYPALITGDDEVYGEIMVIEDERALIWLDELEDYDSSREDNLFNRTIEKVTLEDGKIIECQVYTYADEDYARRKGEYLEHGDWKKYMPL